jgi:hypothetical protein
VVYVLDLIAVVDGASPEELPGVAAALEAARVRLQQRLLGDAARVPAPATSGATRWITAAALIANVSTKTIYEWAVGKRWASRPSRRCLRIDEAGFRSWLASRA